MINIPFTSVLSVPVLKFRIAKKDEGLAIIDTGSEYSVFSKTFVENNLKSLMVTTTGYCIEQVGISNNKKKVPVINAEGTLEFKAGRKSKNITVKAMVTDLSHISNHLKTSGIDNDNLIIIGNDILSTYNTKIDYEKRVITFE